MKDAEEAAKRGFEINKQDSWAHHAVGCSLYLIVWIMLFLKMFN